MGHKLIKRQSSKCFSINSLSLKVKTFEDNYHIFKGVSETVKLAFRRFRNCSLMQIFRILNVPIHNGFSI